MESGNKEKDTVAVETITKATAKFEKEIDLPKGVVQIDGEVTGGKLTAAEAARCDSSNVLKSGIPLKIDFRLVRMPKNESNSIFRAILSKTHDASGSENEPKLYAFFGRDRLLGPVVGEAINLEELKNLAEYLCGACSCQMKRQNPGIDFLTNLDWMGFLEGSEIILDKKLPPLIGLLELTQTVEIQDSESKSRKKPTTFTTSFFGESYLWWNVCVILGLVLLIIIVVTFTLRK
jgi:hypothetical protein